MNPSTPRSTSRTWLVVIVLVLAAVVLFVPGLVFWPRMVGIDSWRLFAPLGLMSVLSLALAIWVGIDAERRCGQGILWGLLVFFTSIIGLVVYLLVSSATERRRTVEARTGTACPNCNGPSESSFKVCPYCGERLERKCSACGRPVRGDWRLCPECGASLRS